MSLRVRLTLMITAILALALTAVSLLAYAAATREANARISATEAARLQDTDIDAIAARLTHWQRGDGLTDELPRWLLSGSTIVVARTDSVSTFAGTLGYGNIPGYVSAGSNSLPDGLDLHEALEIAGPTNEPMGEIVQWDRRVGGHTLRLTARYFKVAAEPEARQFVALTSVDLDAALRPVREALRWLGAAALPGVILGALVAWVVAGRIERPVRAAGRAAEALSGGDLTARVPVTGPPELKAMAASFNTMAGRLNELIADLRASDARHRRFAADAAHELRTPTATLLATASTLAARAPDDDAIARLVAALRRLTGLSEALLELDRLDSGRAELLTDTVDLAGIVRAVAGDVAVAGDLQLRTFGNVTLRADPRMLGGALGNLLQNAELHGRPPINVRVDGTAAEQVLIDIDDSGPGSARRLRRRRVRPLRTRRRLPRQAKEWPWPDDRPRMRAAARR